MQGTDRSTRAGSVDGLPTVALPAGVVRVGPPGTGDAQPGSFNLATPGGAT